MAYRAGETGRHVEYSYDETGNIVCVRQYVGTAAPESATISYEYDKLGQLTRVNDQTDPTAGNTGTTWTYRYDLGGNILEKKQYAYTTESDLTNAAALDVIPYGYDTVWRDKLASYDGKPIAYDEIGNPVRYNGRTYEWKAGRQLAKIRMRTNVGNDGIDAEDGLDAATGTSLRIGFTNGNTIAGEVTSTRAIARVYMNGREITDEFTEKLFKWTRTGGNTTEAENAAWNALHSGTREITLTAADLAGDVRITCTVTGTAGVYGTVQVDTATMIASHTRGESDAGHTFRIEKGDLLLAVPAAEEAPLESDPETDPTEVIEPLPADDGELAEPTDAEGDAAVPDIAEPAEESDLGEGTYIAGEEEAEGYEDPVNDTPEPTYVDVDALPDEDEHRSQRGTERVGDGVRDGAGQAGGVCL